MPMLNQCFSVVVVVVDNVYFVFGVFISHFVSAKDRSSLSKKQQLC